MSSFDFTSKTDKKIDTWIANHERKGETGTELYKALLEERAKRQSSLLDVSKSLQHLVEAARSGIFTTYGDLAKASNVPWT